MPNVLIWAIATTNWSSVPNAHAFCPEHHRHTLDAQQRKDLHQPDVDQAPVFCAAAAGLVGGILDGGGLDRRGLLPVTRK